MLLFLRAASLYLLAGGGYFGACRPGYSHPRHTLNGLRETGATDQRAVS